MSRGRGRGRSGPAANLPLDIIQNIPQGPRPLFPEVKNPAQKLELDDELKTLVKYQRELKRNIRQSPYYLPAEDDSKIDGGAEEFDEGFADNAKLKKKRNIPLHMVMQLDPKYFPEELYSEKQAALSKKAEELLQQRLKRLKGGAEGEHNWQQLEELEKVMSAKEGQDGEGDDDDQLAHAHDEDEDDDQEDDDYYQNQEFDDDDGYEEMDDGRDEPYY
eukprot:TRINITY_DN4083_c1_g1_i10.p3 TRINITY_DN4083_c1_g1~~TRINITY_DN4083_c1_g1_i10.p3  ORF type:complete len:218 (-),score=56.66 TRINITY_DN4083_c1_g1_i10:528-1181(-)